VFKRKNFVLVSLLVFLVLLLSCSNNDRILSELTKVIDSIESNYNLDSRTSIWKIDVEYRSSNKYLLSGETDRKELVDTLIAILGSEYSDFEFINNIKILPDDFVGDKSYGVITNSIGTVRRNPSVSEEMITQTLMGLSVVILKESRGFFLIRTDDGYIGWISNDALVQGGDSLRREWENSEQVVYKNLEGMVYSSSSYKSLPVSDCVLGNRFKLQRNKDNGWSKVAYADGREGYIPSKYLISLEEYLARSPNPDSIVNISLKLLGRPYLWGGTSTKAMDCSGFVQTVFRNNGYLLPRDASMQINEGLEVDTSGFLQNLKPGDLVFFGPRHERITHVGIYIGDLEFIHCSGRVKINSLDPTAPNYSQYRSINLRRVKRIF
jgi:SH3-like domain-containing protein